MKNTKIRSLGRGLISVSFALAFAALSSGCYAHLQTAFAGADSATLHVMATVTTPGGPWGGSGDICYTLNVIGGSDIHDCQHFDMQVPGMINLEKDITSLSGAHGITTSQNVYLVVGGQQYPGSILQTDVSHRNINGMRDSLVNVQAYFQLPASLASNAHVGVPEEALHLALASLSGRPASGNAESITDVAHPSVDGQGSGSAALREAVSGNASI